MTLPEFIRDYIEKDWSYKQKEITDRMINVMTGTAQGNKFEKEYSEVIYKAYKK